MQKIIIMCLAMMSFSYTASCFANEEQMKETLVSIINQLQGIKPLIEQARREQPKNPRVKIHFNTFVDSEGASHAGLKNDVELIEQALIEAVNKAEVEPRVVTPISRDFVGHDRV